jgi:hypothetical protein|tara:strand:+ start:1508 stop:1723 length:216 start_codon:yes stop_codon:yes gene_type:complete
MAYKDWTDEEVIELRAEKQYLSIQGIAKKRDLTHGQVCYALYSYKFEKKRGVSRPPPTDFWTWVSESLGFK